MRIKARKITFLIHCASTQCKIFMDFFDNLSKVNILLLQRYQQIIASYIYSIIIKFLFCCEIKFFFSCSIFSV